MANYDLNSITHGNDTYNLKDNSKIPLSGTNALSGSIVPDTDNAYDFGASSKNIKMIYTKGITINGTQFLPSNYVNLTGAQTIGGTKTFTSMPFIKHSNPYLNMVSKGYIKGVAPSSDIAQGIKFYDDETSSSTNHIVGGFESLYTTSGYNALIINCRNYDQNSAQLNYTLGLYVPNDNIRSVDFRPSASNIVNLGTSTNRWKSISAIRGEFDVINSLNAEVSIFSSSKVNPWEHGAYLSVFGEDYTGDSQRINAFRIVSVNSSTSYNYVLRGDSSGNLSWNGQSIQTTSDQRYKQQITEIDDKLLDAWQDVELVQFKYNDAVDQKGDNARLHTGYVVQQIDSACKSHNVDISEYGLYCHEEYPEETREVEHEDGTKTIEVVRPASEHYSLRYTEALIVECAYLRKCIKELKEEIKELKNK